MCAMAAELELGLGRLIQEPAERKRGEREEETRMLQLMMGSVDRPAPALLLQDLQLQLMQGGTRPSSATMDLVGSSKGQRSAGAHFMMNMIQAEDDEACSGGAALELDSQSNVPLPSGWEKCLNLQTGSIYYLNRSTGLSTSCDPRLMKDPPIASGSQALINHWPTSPSSSSDLTFEGNNTITAQYAASSASAGMLYNSKPEAASSNSPADDSYLNLSLSLRPYNINGRGQSVRPVSPAPSTLISSQNSQGLNNYLASSSANFHLKRSTIPSPSATDQVLSAASAPTPTHYNIPVQRLGSLGTASHGLLKSQQRKPVSMRYEASSPSRANMQAAHDLLLSSSTDSTRAAASNSNSGYHEYDNNGCSSNMITVGCANCLMFVMLPQSCNPKCPRCGASIHPDIYTEQPPPSKKAKQQHLAAGLNTSPLFS